MKIPTVFDHFRTWRALIVAYMAVSVLLALMIAEPFRGQPSAVDTHGDDWSAYEVYARDIRLHGLLLPILPRPFYNQIGYPYALALFRTFAGDGQYPLVFAQAVLVFATGWLLAATARRIGQMGAAFLTLLIFVPFSLVALAIYMTRALSDVLYWFLLALFCYFYAGTPGRRWVAALAFASATFIRSTALPLAIFFVKTPRQLIPVVVIWILVAVRNYVVSGQFAVLPTSGVSYYVILAIRGQSLLLEHLRSLFLWPGQASQTIRGTLWTLGIAGLMAIFVLAIKPIGRKGWVLAGVVFLHAAVIAVFGLVTFGYGIRVGVPVYLFMMPHVGVALWQVGMRVTQRLTRRLRSADHLPHPVV